ncbi:hypothetical protein [Parafrankia sp. BMG5.11]|uniref:hypothetical protein n=1 Tax=Parafrankia sp. BMG5.11 TaxID=222540 RepID=UPI00103E8806|nr:hypothetical protein [Parafrankia sp. BMG5.11]TCJ37373.1 hypothetical protein E0504_20260 [Parafrankia sp. BMG5.11]
MGQGSAAALAATSIDSRRQILEWRDRHLQNAALALSRTWQDLRPIVDEKLDQITWSSALTEPAAYIAREIDPIVTKRVEEVVQRLISDAQLELSAIFEHQLDVETSVGGIPDEPESLQQVTDVLSGLVPVAGGLALGAALPGMAVVSGTAAFGLIATSAVSAPVLVSGLLLAGGALATGVIKTSQIRDARNARIRARIRKYVEAAILSPQSDISVMRRFTIGIEAAAQSAMERLHA